MHSDDTNPAGSPGKRGQFDLTTILVWMAVIALHLSLLQGGRLPSSSDSFLELFLVWVIFLFPASSCIPMLVRKLREANGHRLLSWDRWRFILLVAVYSMLMLMLATIAFEPKWKGSKGMHWGYYLLDGWAGVTLWPIYLVGIVALIRGFVDGSDWMVKSPWCLVHSILLSVISLGYVLAGFLLNFVEDSYAFLIVPGSVAICYILVAAIIVKNRQFAFSDIWGLGALFWGWLASLFAAIVIKIPLAWRMYRQLPDEPPSCFIVTAAAQGHPSLVQSHYDSVTGMWVNRQLKTFRRFEMTLKEVAPVTHVILRAVYNRVGPIAAGCIRNRWLADAIYLLLKPLEWSVRLLMILISQNR